MPDPLDDDALCEKGLAVLEDHLGPVQALRFLALISRQPFDYQQWRQQHFGKMRLDEIAEAPPISTTRQRSAQQAIQEETCDRLHARCPLPAPRIVHAICRRVQGSQVLRQRGAETLAPEEPDA